MQLFLVALFLFGVACVVAKLHVSRQAKARAERQRAAVERLQGFLDTLNANFLAPGENGYAPSFEGGVLTDGSEYFRIHGEVEGQFGFDCAEITSGEEVRYRFLFQWTEGYAFQGEARGAHPLADRFAALFGKYRRFQKEVSASFKKARAGGPSSSKIDLRKVRGEDIS